MVPSRQETWLASHRFPRASGDGPKAAIPQTGTDPFPPRERGWSLLRSFAEPQVLVSPARAGMVPPWHSCTKKR